MIAASTGAEAKKCVLAGGEGSGLTPDIAKFMANAALNNSIKNGGMAAAGEVKVTCKTDPLLSTCKASQRACK